MKTELTEVKSYLPVFPGFYGTRYEADETNEIDDINSERKQKGLEPISYEQCEFDYSEYENEIAKKACELIKREIKNYSSDIVFECVYSPKFYNFENDSINCTYLLSEENIQTIKTYLNNHLEAFSDYLKEKFTSCSGFISFYSNEVSEWMENIDECINHQTKLGSILDFIVRNENKDIEDEMYEYCSEGICIYALNYDKLTSE